MNFVLDVHCHTVNSTHAYSTISENAEHAASIGLTHIGISDHAPAMPGGAHLYHFVNIWSLPDIIKGVRVFKGAEVNIMNERGKVDLENNFLKNMDFVIAAMHRGVLPALNRKADTNALINAMENPHVHIIGHPLGAWYEIDVEALVEAAARTHTILEVNEKSINPGSNRYNGDEDSVKMLELCKEMDVPVLVSSDAHFCTEVGSFNNAKTLIESAGLKESLVLNTNVELFLNAIQRKRQVAFS